MPLMPGATWAGFGQCEISPSDLASNVDNLFSKIAALEQRVALLEAANTTANQLSDIAAQLGWVTNVNYNGIGGFIQTPNGTLIPPPGVSLSDLGWTMSDGNSYNFGLIDANGNLVWGMGTTPAGTPIIAGSQSSGSRAAYFSDGNIHAASTSTYSGTAAWLGSGNYDPDGLITHPSSTALQVNVSGWYMVTLGVSLGGSYTGGDNAELIVSVGFSPNTAPFDDTNFPSTSGVNVYFQPRMTFGQTLTSSRLCYIDRDAVISMGYTKSGTSNLFIGKAMVTFQLVKAE